ncbi:type VII secretion-associated serine protease mycosin [Streptomyces sp. NRRL S-340]|uniref:type VII secretion-associated serine protease mycosin n=1 Tax=Streptomyces sp. NRRL S-340 TaxID=1463901 RepID=UPI00068DF649|nr:type VII secretion-associated serine protease mycosin [Streptomyces sp. NRRL S-340]
MAIRRNRRAAGGALTSAALAMLTVGLVAPSAHAESTREQQWFLDAMKAEQMWQSSTGEGITVAVIDSGVDPTNPDLKGRVLRGRDFARGESGDEHTDYEGHGTGMAGLIAGTGAYAGGKGAFGLAPGAKILPVRVPRASSAANAAESSREFNQTLPEAIRYAAQAGARVINISLGDSQGSPQLNTAVKYALSKGSLIFASVGNSGNSSNQVEYPAATPGVVGVAAVGKNLRRTAESEFGPQVDMSAPGDQMVHACGGGTGLCRSHGTSDATALASASAALIWAKHPDWTNNQVLRVMLNTIGGPTDGARRNDSIGYGIVRPRIALENPGDPGPADVYPLPDLAAAASPSPTVKAPGAKGAGGADDTSPAKGEAGASAGSGDGDGVLWLGAGLAAVVVIGGAAAAFVLARRRRLSGAEVSREAAAAAASRYLSTVAYPDRAGSVTVLPETGTEFAYGWAFRFEFREHSGARTQANPRSDYVIVVPHSGAAPHFPPPDIPTARYMELCADRDRHPAV